MNTFINKTPQAMAFLNTRAICPNTGFSLGRASAQLGDFFLTPIRYRYDGHKVTITNNNSVSPHVREYTNQPKLYPGTKKNFLRTAASIIFFIPGLLLGSFFKSLSLLSKSEKLRQNLVVTHYTPVNRVNIGSKAAKVSTDLINTAINDVSRLHRPTKIVTVYARDGVNINNCPKLLELNPTKIIWVQQPHAEDLEDVEADPSLPEAMERDPTWSINIMKGTDQKPYFLSFYKKNIQSAVDDVLPKGRKAIYSVYELLVPKKDNDMEEAFNA